MPIAATRRATKSKALLEHGACHVIATEESDLVAEVMKITGGKGARIVFDPVGGPYVDTLAQAMAVDGVLEASDGVHHLIARRLHDYSMLLPELAFASRDFH